MKETIINNEDVMEMLDSLLREPSQFWDDFYTNRNKGIPFFVNKPDENLVEYVNKKIVHPGKVLELGCGPGRNAIFLTEQGFQVDAVDLSEVGLKWGQERAEEKNLAINFIREDIFKLSIDEGAYDFVYDSGCLHHIAPHRRLSYIELVKKALKPGGFFGLTCFVENGPLGGADISDWEVYRIGSLKGGLGYTEEKLKNIFYNFEVLEIREMQDAKQLGVDVFGVEGLLTALFSYRKV